MIQPLDLAPFLISLGNRVAARADRARLARLAHADTEARRLKACRERMCA